MALVLPSEIETAITAKNGIICLHQVDGLNGEEDMISLTVHQFRILIEREKEIIRAALGTGDEL